MRRDSGFFFLLVATSVVHNRREEMTFTHKLPVGASDRLKLWFGTSFRHRLMFLSESHRQFLPYTNLSCHYIFDFYIIKDLIPKTKQ